MDMEKLKAALVEMATDPLPLPIHLTRWYAYCVVAAVQLACRHPLFVGDMRTVAESVARQIQDRVVTDPLVAEVTAAGWNPNVNGESLESGLSDISRLDLAPRPSGRDLADIGALLSENESHFSARLIRLVKSADRENRERLRRVYPHHVDALEHWELTRGGA